MLQVFRANREAEGPAPKQPQSPWETFMACWLHGWVVGRIQLLDIEDQDLQLLGGCRLRDAPN